MGTWEQSTECWPPASACLSWAQLRGFIGQWWRISDVAPAHTHRVSPEHTKTVMSVGADSLHSHHALLHCQQLFWAVLRIVWDRP